MSQELTPLPNPNGETSNFLDEFQANDLEKSRVSAGVTGFISAAGLVCNLVVILVIILLKDYKKTTHWYVLNLALADSMFLAMLPLNLVQSLYGEWKFGFTLCVMFQGAFYVNYYAGVLFLAVMSFDRYIAIAHPVSHSWRRIRSTTGSRLISLAVWAVAIGASAPLMANTTLDGGLCDFSFESIHPDCVAKNITARHCTFYLQLKNKGTIQPKGNETASVPQQRIEDYMYNYIEDDYEDAYEGLGYDSETAVPDGFTLPQAKPGINCQHLESEDYVTWIIGNFVLSFVVPLVVMAACYGGILWRIQHPRIRSTGSGFIVGKKRRNSSTTSDNATKTVDRKLRITVLVVSLIVVFVVCWTPFHAVILAKIPGINLSSESCTKLKDAALLIAYSNSLLNPIMYTFLGINFGKRLRMAGSRVVGRTLYSRTGSRRGSGIKSVSGAATKLTKASSSSEPPMALAVDMPMHQIDRNALKRDEDSVIQNGSIFANGHVVKITEESIDSGPNERMLGGIGNNN